MAPELSEVPTGVIVEPESTKTDKDRPTVSALGKICKVVEEWEHEDPLENGRLTKRAKETASCLYTNLVEGSDPSALIEDLEQANVSFDREQRIRVDRLPANVRPQAEAINNLSIEKRLAVRRMLQSVSMRAQRAEIGIEGFQQLPSKKKKREFNPQARGLSYAIASKVESTARSIVEDEKDFKSTARNLFNHFESLAVRDPVVFEESIAYIFANLDKKGYLAGEKLILADNLAQRREIRQMMTRVLKSLRERNRQRYFQTEIIDTWKKHVPDLENQLGLPEELHGAAKTAKIIHELSKKHNFDPFAERKEVVKVVADATRKSELKVAQRIARLRNISVEKALGRKLKLGERLRNLFSKRELKKTVAAAVTGIVIGSCLSPFLAPVVQAIGRQATTTTESVKPPTETSHIDFSDTSDLPPREKVSEEKPKAPVVDVSPREKLAASFPIAEKKDQVSPLEKKTKEKVTEVEKEAPPPKEVETVKTEISQPDRISFPCVKEAKYLPVESYTQKNGETKTVVPEEIIIHWDAQPNAQDRSPYITYNGLAGRTRSGDPVSTHFSVGPGGLENGPAVLQMLPMGSSEVTMGILSDGPSKAINIETTGSYFDEELPPEEQTENLIQLLIELMEQYNIPFGNITGHLERSPDVGKPDPGQKYLNMVRARLLEKLISQGKWRLIGSPKDWDFHKQVRNKETGELSQETTQIAEDLFHSLSPSVQGQLAGFPEFSDLKEVESELVEAEPKEAKIKDASETPFEDYGKEYNLYRGEIAQKDGVVFTEKENVIYLPEECYSYHPTLEQYEENPALVQLDAAITRPQEIIIHWDGQPWDGENKEGLKAEKTVNDLQARGLSSHFVVDPEKVLQLLSMGTEEVTRGFHARDFNTGTIGIETTGSHFDEKPPPEEQTERLVNLVEQLMIQYKIPFSGVVGHYERSYHGKSDPGPEYMKQVRVELAKRLIQKHPELIDESVRVVWDDFESDMQSKLAEILEKKPTNLG